jgi:RNA polymerase sigma-70 factor (ECF subfamily)
MPDIPPSSAPTEGDPAAELVRRIAAGEDSAEDELVRRYSRGVLLLLRRRCGGADLAEDLHQETFRIVLERLRDRGLEDPSRLAGFLHGTAENLFRAHRRKVHRRKTHGEDALPERADPRPGQLEGTLHEEAASLVRRLLADLHPPRDRQILYRFYLAEETKERICADYGLTSLHFNRVLHRARQRLKQLLERSEKRRRLGLEGGQA